MNHVITCEVCSKEFVVAAWEIRKRNPRFCSRQCSGKVNPARFLPGNKHWNFKTGRRIDGDGYVKILDRSNPRAKSGYVLEHILIMEEHLGRQLTKDEVVHHINEVRTDNRLENLELMTRAEHVSHHNDIRFGRRPRSVE